MFREWDKLPAYMKTEEVRPYYDILKKRKWSLKLKRIFDFTVALIMIIVLSPILVFIAILVVEDSKGGVFYRQERVTQYGRKFRILKFRTMVVNADKIGSQVTIQNDNRITKVGRVLRKYRLDELPQLINIMLGDMSFVGTRPESIHYVKKYTPIMFATLLLPAGVTSEASIRYKDEAKLLDRAEDVDEVYVKQVLPAKMKYNLDSIESFGFRQDVRTMLKTMIEVLR